MLRYKIDVLDALKKAGYSSTRLRRDHLLAEGTMTKLRAGIMGGIDTLDTICRLLHKQPGSIIEWVPDE